MEYTDPDWVLYDFEDPKPFIPPKVETLSSECPKCGKKLGKGRHFHLKACNGSPEASE